MEIRDYLRILRTRWVTILVVVFVGLAGALTLTLLTTPVYQATTRLMVSTPTSANPSEAYSLGLLAQQQANTYVLLAGSDRVAEQSIDSMKLAMSVSALKARISTQVVPGTAVVLLSVIDEDPATARNLARGVSQALIHVAENPVTKPEATSQGTALAASSPTSLAVIDDAPEPTTPLTPNMMRNLMRGLLVGLALGIGTAFLRDQFDSRVKTAATLSSMSGLPVVGDLPYDRTFERSIIVDFRDNRSQSAEAYRSLRTNLKFLNVDHSPRTIVITSSKPGEGKTTIATNLAISLTEAGNSVVLLDCDIRRPRVASALNLVDSVGLTTVLAGLAELDDVRQPHSIPRLSVVGSGPIPPNPSELLGSDTFKMLVQTLRRQADYVIIDAPPLLVTDAAVVGTVVDGVILVARHDSTRREDVQRSMTSLRAVGVTPLGAVLTMTAPKEHPAGDYYLYYEDSTVPRQSKPIQVRPALR